MALSVLLEQRCRPDYFFPVSYSSLPPYGSQPIVLLHKLHLHGRTQHRFILNRVAPLMYATCFGPFSGHHQACQYKNVTKKDITR